MKFKKATGRALVLSMLLGALAAAEASSPGLTTTPAGAIWSRGDSNTAFGVFDTFPGTSYTNDGADSSSGITGLTLSQGTTFTNFGQGASTYSNISTFAAGNDILFAGGNAVTFTLAGSTSFNIGSVYVSLKRPNSVAGVAPDFTLQLSLDNGSTWFNAETNSFVAGTGDTATSTSGNYSLTTWAWTDAALTNSNSSSLKVRINSNGASQRAIDGIEIDVAAVPEPSTYALLLLGGGALVLLYRSKKIQAQTI